MAQAKTPPVKNNRRRPGSSSHRAAPIVNKPRQATATRESLRLQKKPPDSQAARPQPVQPFLSPRASPKQKRYRHAEVEADEPNREPPSKQPQITGNKADESEGPPELPQEAPPLSEKDSQTLQSVFAQVMASAASNSLKRTPSRRSEVQTETGTYQTQRSTITTGNATYRRETLAAVRIHLHAEPPDDVETTIKEVVNAKVPEHRRTEIRAIAEAFHIGCLDNVRSQTGEDDCLRPLRAVIVALCPGNMCIREKAPWRGELKPVIRQQPHFNLSFMAGMGVDDTSVKDSSVPGTPVPLQKRQRTSAKLKSINENYVSPERSMANIPILPANDSRRSSAMPLPVVLEKNYNRSPVKTPHPDLCMGIKFGALISALSSEDLDETVALDFIQWIQDQMVQHDTDGPLEPLLLLSPAARAPDLAFPFVVVEGKAYSTGKQIFEAENQAAVALACAHKILLCLDRVAYRGNINDTQPRVLFSFTTQGPIHELWAHWTILRHDVRMFESKLWDSWNGLVLDRAEDFITKLNNVFVWGMGPFMESVVGKLGEIAMQART